MTHVNRGNSTRNYTVFPWKLPMCCIFFELPAAAQNGNSFGLTEELWGNTSPGLYLYYGAADLMTVDPICVTILDSQTLDSKIP